MNVKRIKARTTREALAIIRQSLGEEAVILSNRSVPGGVEIMAMPAEDLMVVASEAENAALRIPAAPPKRQEEPAAQRSKPRARTAPSREDAAPAAEADIGMSADFARLLREADSRSGTSAGNAKRAPKVAQPSAARAYRREADAWNPDAAAETAFQPFAPLDDAADEEVPGIHLSQAAPANIRKGANAHTGVSAAQKTHAAEALPPGVLRAQSPAVKKPADESSAAVPAELAREIAALRALVENRLPNDATPAAKPEATTASVMLDGLMDNGFSPMLARRVMEKFPQGLQGRDAQDWLQAVLVRNLQCARHDQDPVTVGGVYAFVGPTGVGKTTTIAKLAARALVRHGAGQVALISADNYRIGALDQLDWYGRMLGLPVRRVKDQPELRAALAEFADRKLVLIDTAGMSQRDSHVAEQQALLREEGVRRVVLLNAGAQAETLDDVVRAYLGDVPPSEALAIITKLDEAVKLGGVVDCAVRRRLGLLYVTTGQRVPEDLHPAHARYLVDKAMRHAHSPVFTRQAEARLPVIAAARRKAGVEGALHA